MNIVCIICSDLLTPSDDVFHTPCGHIFHFHCVTQWLERSKSCPQCREKTSQTKIHRLYFNFSNNDTIVQDSILLQEQIDKLKFQLLLKEKDIKYFSEKTETLQKHTAGLRAEVRKVERELASKNSDIYALKEQTKFFKQQCSEVDATKLEIQKLKKKMEDLKHVQILMDGPALEVDEMVAKTRDPVTLVTYISILKREMTNCMTKRRDLRAKMKSLQMELTKVSMERNFLTEEYEQRKLLEQKLAVCNAEKSSLEEKVKEQESLIREIKRRYNVSLDERDEDSTGYDVIVEEANSRNHTTDKKQKEGSSTKESQGRSSQEDDEENTPDSPELLLKSHGIVALKERSDDRATRTSQNSSFFTKKSRLTWAANGSNAVCKNGMAYDGYGGHSRLETFPTSSSGSKPQMKRSKTFSIKSKKPKLDTGGNQKLGGFMIDLTHVSSFDDTL